jgi:hypothetical protein
VFFHVGTHDFDIDRTNTRTVSGRTTVQRHSFFVAAPRASSLRSVCAHSFDALVLFRLGGLA